MAVKTQQQREQERQAEEAARAAQRAAQQSGAYHDVGPGTTPEGRALLDKVAAPGTKAAALPSGGYEEGLPTTKKGEELLKSKPWPKSKEAEAAQKAAQEAGAYHDEVRPTKRELETKAAEQTIALGMLKRYETKDGQYDIVKFIKENPDKEKVLQDAGFKKADVRWASETAKLNLGQKMWRGMTPWAEEKGEKVTAKGAAAMAAEIIVPGVYVAKHWNELSPAERAAFIALDVVSLIPFVGAAAKGAKVVGTAGRAARIAAATRAVGREAIATAVAPVNMVIHPVSATKTTLREVRNLAENIAHPRKIPEVVITTSEGTVRLKVSETTSKAEAMAFRDALMEKAARGERPIVKIGDQTVELTRSPLMKELKGGLTHATPSGEAFESGLKVTTKPGMRATEQGLFMSHEPLPRFTEATAYGKTGEKPAIIITSRETAQKAITSGKIYDSPIGAVAEMERKFPVGTDIPAPKQSLFTRVGPTSQRVEILLEKPLTPRQIAKLKARGLVELVTAPFQPAIKIKGTGKVAGLTGAEVKQLSKVLKASGNVDQAANLLRAERLARTYRVAPRALSRLTGRVSAGARRAELRRLGITTTERVRAGDREPRADRRLDRLIREAEMIRDRAERTTPERARAERARVEREAIRERPERERPGRERPTRERPELDRTRVDRERPERERPEVERPRIGRGRIEPERVKPAKELLRFKLKEQDIARIKSGKATEAEKREIIRNTPGAVTQNMGKLGKPLKDVWHTWLPDGTHLVVFGKKPVGARITADGPRSAYKTTQAIGGGLRREIQHMHGAVRTTITPARIPKGVKATFAPRATRTQKLPKSPSVKVGKIYYTPAGNATLMSRRPLGRRRGRR